MSLMQQAQPQADPQAQGQQYKALITQIGQFIYSDQGVQMISEAFKSGAQVADVIPMIVSRIFETVAKSAMGQGKKLPPDMVVLAMIEITQAVLEMAAAAGAISEGDIDAMGQGAFMQAAQNLDKSMGGQMDDQTYGEYQQIFSQFGGQQ